MGPSLDVTIDLGDALRGLPPGAALFVSARKPGERMPLLVARQPVDAATMTVRLDRTNAMQGDVTLNEGETLNVAARVSASGALSVGADDPHANQDGVTLKGGVTPVRLMLGEAAAPSPPPVAVTDVAVRLSVALAPGVEATPPARVFVIARAPDGPPLPIAVRALDPTGSAAATRADRSRRDAAESRIEHVPAGRGVGASVALRQSDASAGRRRERRAACSIPAARNQSR